MFLLQSLAAAVLVNFKITSKSTPISHVDTVFRVSQPPGRGPVPGPGINLTGPREA